MTWEVKRIPLWPVAKVGFILYFAIALVGFLIYALFIGGMMSMMGQMVGQEFNMPTMTGGALLVFGFFMAVVASIFYTVITLLAVLLYNAVSSMTGGIQVELARVAELGAMVPPGPPPPPADLEAPLEPETPPEPPPPSPEEEMKKYAPPEIRESGENSEDAS